MLKYDAVLIDRGGRMESLATEYTHARNWSLKLVDPLETEDFTMQSHPLCSPANWHLAHVTWFFETFLLKEFLTGYTEFNPKFNYLFNSYYNAIGDRVAQAERRRLSRPTVKEILAYREHVDQGMMDLLERPDAEIARRVRIGINHEQQHQELILTDIKSHFAAHPLQPAYVDKRRALVPAPSASFSSFDEGVVEIGYGGTDFCYDNEQPRHKTFVQQYSLQNRLVTNEEYLEFMKAGGYEKPQYWLADGWNVVQQEKWTAPLYWSNEAGWKVMTLLGKKDVDLQEPVCHVSFYEADAFARWKGMRLPTEAEWEHAAAVARPDPAAENMLEDEAYHVRAPKHNGMMMQLYGDVWEWTSSAYGAYPGFVPEDGAIGEYNGKFMNNARVLKGGSFGTPRAHIRTTYRNFWAPETRWQFSGIRLAGNRA